MYKRHQTGISAESRAEDHLTQQGLCLVQRNYRCKSGEIDLIMTHNEYLVFVEVRYRQQSNFGSAVESVTQSKQRKLISAAQHFLLTSGRDQPCRFDIIGIDSGTQITWLKDAFQT